MSGAGSGFYFADSRDEAVLRTGVVLDCNDPLGSGGDSVMPQVHRCGACMVGLSGEDEFHASLSDECLDDSKRCIFALEHGALFDMNFEIGEGFAGQSSGGKRRGVEA